MIFTLSGGGMMNISLWRVSILIRTEAKKMFPCILDKYKDSINAKFVIVNIKLFLL